MEALEARLRAQADEGYRAFMLPLMPGIAQQVLGVRMPALRKLAREILRGDWQGFLDSSLGHPIHEVRLLHALVLGGAPCDLDEKLRRTEAFLRDVENWAVCDSFVSAFRAAEADRDALLDWLLARADAPVEYVKRFSLVMMMTHFADCARTDEVLCAYRRFRDARYYARMTAAWGLATLFIARREGALDILRAGVWDDFTHNKAIDKIRDSLRVSPEDKAMVRALRRGRRTE